MSRVGVLLEALRISMAERAPAIPDKIIVTSEYFRLSCEPDFRTHTTMPPGGSGLLFAGVPIESVSGGEEGFSFRIEYSEQQE